MISEALYRKYYDHAKYDGTLVFYDWMRAHIRSDFRILNLGAGPATRNPQRVLRGAVREVVGADIDPIVLNNDELDAAVVIQDGKVPLESDRFDLAYADFVLEHVENPPTFLSEIYRVLKSGGRFFFRTPNKFHYVAVISAATPHAFHRRVANPVRGLSDDAHEPWPTFYRMNSRRALREQAHVAGFGSTEFRMIEAQPSYLMFHPVPFMVGVGYERVVNSTNLLSELRSVILGRFTK